MIGASFIPVLAPVAQLLQSAGAGLLLSGIGTMLAGHHDPGFSTAQRNPIAPWQVVCGTAEVGGTVVYISSFGTNSVGTPNAWLDIVVVVAAHLSYSVDAILFDKQRLTISPYVPSVGGNTTYTPKQQQVDIGSITRVNNVVTVTLPANIPYLYDGDYLLLSGIEPVALNLNGKFPVTVLTGGQANPTLGSCSFYFLSGGPSTSSMPVTRLGGLNTLWADYGTQVYVESINDLGGTTGLDAPYNIQPRTGGVHTPTVLGTTFYGMIGGTPQNGSFSNGTVQNNGPGNGAPSYPNPWTANYSLVGFTAVMLRLEYDSKRFAGGIPQISFRVRGQVNIVDPRTSPPTVGWSQNAALLIANYLNNPIWGFNAAWGTEIDLVQLAAAANICDESVTIANPTGATEPRYTCNGRFNLDMSRGEVLRNMLTSCAGRLTYLNGLFGIWPAAWFGSTATVVPAYNDTITALGNTFITANASGPIRWRSSVTINNRYNGVKGTYISPTNNWQASDFPRYAQDVWHGYNDGTAPEYDVNLDADEGQRRWKDIQLPFTISSDMAQRLAKIELMRSLQMGTGTFLLNMAGYQLAPMDVIQMTFTNFGWTNKYLEVQAVRFKIEKEQSNVVLLGVEIDVQETDPSVYDFELIEGLSPQGYTVPGVPDTLLQPDIPTNLQVDGGILTWTPPMDGYVTTIQGQYQLVASPPGLFIQLGTVPVSVTQMELPGLLSGETYLIQIRGVNAAGVPSQWASITTVGYPYFSWAPYQVRAPSTDALYPNEYTFDLSQVYIGTSGVDWTAIASITGAQPINAFISGSTPPLMNPQNITVLTTGGSIPGGSTVYLAIGALDANGNATPASELIAVAIPSGTNTNQIVIGAGQAVMLGTFDGVTNLNPTNIAGKNYLFQSTLTNVDGNVAIGSTLAQTITNLYNAINLGPGAGTAYASAMTANGNCLATSFTSTTISLIATSAFPGSAGNDLGCSGTADWANSVGGTGSFYNGSDGVSWPTVSGLTTYGLFASLNDEDLICAQVTGSLSFSGSPPSYSPVTGLTLSGPFARSTWAMPYSSTQKIRVKGAYLLHGGVEGMAVDSLTTNSITAGECIDAALIDNWAGRVIACIGRNNSSGPFCSFNVTAFNPATGDFTLASNPIAAGVQVGDAFVVCYLGVSNSGNPYVFSDPGISNAQSGHMGQAVPDPALVGMAAMVIKGTSRGMSAHIVSNTATSITLDAPIPIDSTSVWVIMSTTWSYQQDSVAVDNQTHTLPTTIPLNVDNAVGGSIVVAAFTVDDGGNESFLDDAPIRMLYVWGSGMAEVLITSASPPTAYQMLDTDQIVYVDATAGPQTIILPNTGDVRISPRAVQKIDTSANTVTIVGFGSPPQTIGSASAIYLTVQGQTFTLAPSVVTA